MATNGPLPDGFYDVIVTVDYTDNLVRAALADLRKKVEGLATKTTKRSDPNAALAAVLAVVDRALEEKP